MKPLRSIAVVDDDLDILAITELCLRDLGGYDVTTFTSGANFIQAVEDHSFDMVISDMMMPMMTGLDILSELRARRFHKKLMIIFMTAKVQKHEVESYREAGATDVIIKPFDPLSLADQVSTIWSENLCQISPVNSNM